MAVAAGLAIRVFGEIYLDKACRIEDLCVARTKPFKCMITVPPEYDNTMPFEFAQVVSHSLEKFILGHGLGAQCVACGRVLDDVFSTLREFFDGCFYSSVYIGKHAGTQVPSYANLGIALTCGPDTPCAAADKEFAQSWRLYVRRACRAGGGPMNYSCIMCRRDREPGKAKFKCCARCRLEHYCSEACQTQHWPKHKLECARMKNVEERLGAYFRD